LPITYTPDKPGTYRYDDVYKSAIDGPSPTNLRVVPALGSIVTFPGTAEVKMVVAIDLDPNSVTYRDVTLSSVSFPLTDPELSLVNYGKDLLMLYYDTRQSPTRIIVDNKLALFSSNTVGYRIIRTDDEGHSVVISSRLDNNNNVVGDIIPITDSGVNHQLIYSAGHTLFALQPGEIVRCEIVDSAGVVTIEAQLTTKPATILNTYELASNPITGFDSDFSQIRGDDWLLYLHQDISELTMSPYISFADGTIRRIVIDNLSTYMYGLEEVNNTFPGNQYTVVIKYYLGKDELSTINEEVDGLRFVTLTKNLIVDSREKYTFSKIAVIPIWSNATGRYSLRYIGYHESRNALTDLTSVVTYPVGYVFDNSMVNQQQEVHISAPFTNPDGSIADDPYNQTFFITLSTPGTNEPFLISPTAEGVAYGSNNATYDRPHIYYDADIQQYFISSVSFPTTAALLNNFYYAATPPYLIGTEIAPPVPTHFTIRDAVSLRPLLLVPQVLADYNEAMTFLTLAAPANSYVNSTVLVEWLSSTTNGYIVLYSVPVEVTLSVTGYQG